MRSRTISAALALLALAAGLWPVAAQADTARERAVNGVLQSLRGDPDRLQPFMHALPKGGDLHTHLSGAVYAETLVRLGADDGMCLDPMLLVASPPPCDPELVPLASALSDNVLYNRVIAAWSMRDFTPGVESGHDHFFASFDKFGAISGRHTPDLLAEVASRAAAENELYVEPLITPGFSQTSALARRVGFDGDMAGTLAKLAADGAIPGIVASVRSQTDANLAGYRQLLRCGTPQAARACDLPIRFDVQVLRAMPPATVFAQLVVGFELMKADPRWVGLNLVQPEDALISLRDYGLHMRMIRFLRTRYPGMNVTLHAGELTAGTAPPADLRFHIREAVEVAGAQRIGHGVDLAYEHDPTGLLRTMARRRVMVEINLTSNAQILGVRGRAHPFPRYLRAGVPVALSTDDEGVERTDLTQQYVSAFRTYGLRYAQLKRIARTSLEYAFLEGRSLWRDRRGFRPVAACAGQPLGGAHPSARCRAFLDASAKADAQWREEAASSTFERRYARAS